MYLNRLPIQILWHKKQNRLEVSHVQKKKFCIHARGLIIWGVEKVGGLFA